jgi:NADPH-dependent glutamate synthase beta subunit-like oxidoreductase
LSTKPRIAIVGGGPAGRAAARRLAEADVPVTLYDKEPEAGGLMRFGYPEFRMPTAAPRRDAAALKRLGVKFKFEQELGKTITLDRLTGQYDSVLLATGAPKPKRLGVPDEDLPGVYRTLDFLHAARVNQPLPIGRRVLVIGGGDTAMDAANTSRRLGSPDVTVMYRGSRAKLRALPHEIKRAESEGVKFKFNLAPQRIEQIGKSLKVEATDGSMVEADTVIIAIGQETDTPFLKSLGLTVKPDGSTNHPKVFVAGGTLYGSNRLAKAILDGRRAADNLLKNLP